MRLRSVRFLPLTAPVFFLFLAPAFAQGQISEAEFHERRTALMDSEGEGLILALGTRGGRLGHLSFQYLTGLDATNSVLLVERLGDAVLATLFPDPSEDDLRWADGGVFAGERPGADGGAGGFRVAPLATLQEELAAALDRHGSLTLVGPDDLRGMETAAAALVDQVVAAFDVSREGEALEVRRGNARVAQLRSVKSPAELALIRQAVGITEAAHRALLEAIRPGVTEADLKVVIDSVFRAHGADERNAFGHIVASAENSTILHYRGGDRRLGEGEHVKIDIGAAVHGYAADVTRTYPVNGVFSEELRAIYQVVRDAQARAEAMASEGAARNAMSTAADGILARGLAELGLIEAEDAVYDCPVRGQDGAFRACRQLGLLYFHALGHGIGLNVHDPTPTETVPGSAISIEPGIYVRPGHLETLADTPRNREMIARVREAWARFDGVGVRIEDNYVMTGDGLTWISRAPREIDEIEAAMAEAARRRTQERVSGRPSG